MPWYGWLLFVAGLVVLLALDLFIVHREPHAIHMKEAAITSAVWIGAGLAFTVVVGILYDLDAVQNYLTGFLIEKSLSVDNLFVFVLIFDYFQVPSKYQHRVLFYGILGAFAFRGLFIALGSVLLAKFSWVAFVFGGFLIFTAVRLATRKENGVHPERNPVLRALRRLLPMTEDYRGAKILIREQGRWLATPLLAVLVVLETTDILFAIDSVPAIFGVTRNTFIVFSSNAFALLGLRALYFLLADAVERFHYLDVSLGLILGLIGVKMIYEELVDLHHAGRAAWFPDVLVWEIPPWAPLLLVGAVLAVGIALSIATRRSGQPSGSGTPDADA